MLKYNLHKICNFAKNNGHFSDFNLVNDYINFNKNKNNTNMTGGNGENQNKLNVPQLQMTDVDNSMFPQDAFVQGPQDAFVQRPQNANAQGLQYANANAQGPGNSEMTPNESKTTSQPNDDINRNNGTQLEQNITDNNINGVNLYLQKPVMEKIYTINKGTILFYAGTQKAFDPKNIKLGEKNMAALFTPNFKLSKDQIKGCGITKQVGYIHAFEVTEDIKNIFIENPYEDIDIKTLENKFCSNGNNYNGVGFFYPKNNIDEFNDFQNGTNYTDSDKYYFEFLLCKPNNYLTYLYTQQCLSLRHLSEQYRFDYI